MITDKALSERLYETYYMQVYSYVMTLAGRRETAEEITQECFFRAMTTHRSFRGDSEEYTWLCAIAKNLFHDEMRRQGRQAPLTEQMQTDAAADPLTRAADADSSFRIHLVLHSMEEPYKEVFELRCFGELSFRQIGLLFGRTESWARVTYHRARLKIQERMGKR